MKRHLILSAVLLSASLSVRAASGVLVEAESFASKGGWVVDQQFVEQMGSPYLLAHGLGKPVTNASTTVRIPEGGSYRVWVRTKNWAPGDWEAPGRFKVILNGRALDSEFGVIDGWTWQSGGAVDLPAGDLRVELEDLTGFDGRCDAIYFSADAGTRPPDDLKAMAAWRDQLLGSPAEPESAGEFDVVIVGGGISGCAAALAAAEQGLRVALVHDRPILGGNASAEVRVHTIGITGYSDRILKKINSRHWPNGSAEAIADDRKRHETMDAATNVQQFLRWRAYGVVMDGDRIARVNARHTETGRRLSFTAPSFIDATGDGWIGFWAGAEYRYGREARDEFNEGWETHGDLWSPAAPDKRVMGVSLLWGSEPSASPAPFPDVPWALAVSKNNVEVRGEWFWEYSEDRLDMMADAEQIRDHVLRAIYGSFANAKKLAKYSSHELAFVGYVSGKRESRRLMGDYIYTMADMTEGRKFPDAVVTETREIDVHYQRAYKDPAYPYDYLSTALFKKTPRYYVPFRCLYSKNIANLMMAGRNFSCSHVGLGGPRVMNTCGQMGAATGYAAALIKKHKTTPRGVYKDHLDELVALVRPDPSVEQAWSATDRPAGALQVVEAGKPFHRVIGRFPIEKAPEGLDDAIRVVPERGEHQKPAAGSRFMVNQPVVVFMAVHDRGSPAAPEGWSKTDLRVAWELGTDTVYRREFPAGRIRIPGHAGKDKSGNFGLPHLLFVKTSGAAPQTGLKITELEQDR